jgi:hypothetical protein
MDNPQILASRRSHMDHDIHDIEATASKVLPNLIRKRIQGKARPNSIQKDLTYSWLLDALLDAVMMKIESSPTALKAAQQVADSPENMALQTVLKTELVNILVENPGLAKEIAKELAYLAKELATPDDDWRNVTYTGLDHVDAAAPSLNRMIILVGVLGLLIVGGGICAIILNAVSDTRINIAGMSISTGHVGVAFIGLGIIMVIRVYRHISSIIFKLAELPDVYGCVNGKENDQLNRVARLDKAGSVQGLIPGSVRFKLVMEVVKVALRGAGWPRFRREISRKKPVVKNRVDEETEKAVVALAIEQPAFGQVRAANELKQRGIFISSSGVRRVWMRHDLETFKKRVKALEAKSVQENFILTEAQVVAIERAKKEKEIERNTT